LLKQNENKNLVQRECDKNSFLLSSNFTLRKTLGPRPPGQETDPGDA